MWERGKLPEQLMGWSYRDGEDKEVQVRDTSVSQVHFHSI